MIEIFIAAFSDITHLGVKKKGSAVRFLIGRCIDPAGNVSQVDKVSWCSSLHEYQNLQGKITGELLKKNIVLNSITHNT